MVRVRKHVAYYRVSTAMQGQSGLGLEAQRAAVASFLKGEAPAAEFTEVESGKRSDRPQLAAAMKHAKAIGATLVVAKIDRLARNLHFITALMDPGSISLRRTCRQRTASPSTSWRPLPRTRPAG